MIAGLIIGVLVILALHAFYAAEVARVNRRPLSGGEPDPEEPAPEEEYQQ